MKRLIFFIISTFTILSMSAVTTYVNGNIGEIISEKSLPVVVDWSEAVYNNYGDIDDFLAKAVRIKDWEEESMKYFYYQANDILFNVGLKLSPVSKAADSRYLIVIKPYAIDKYGYMWGDILICYSESKSPLATFSFSTDDFDDDDSIPFKDQMENIGKTFGKALSKQIKKSR